MIELRVRKIGNSLGVILPREVLAMLKVGEGDTLYLTEAPDGFLLTKHDTDRARQIEAMRTVMHDYRETLRVLAK